MKDFNQNDFISRNLNDTRYISKFCLNYIQDHLLFSDSSNLQPVRVLTGQATAFIRANWGFKKNRNKDDLHHALDACIIAAVSTSIQQKIIKFMRAKEYGRNNDNTYTDADGEIFNRFPMPNNNFRTNVLKKVDQVFVSRMAKRTVSGSIHDATIRSIKYIDQGYSTVKKPLKDSNIKVNKNGEIDKLCKSYKIHNPNIYELIKQRLLSNNNDYKKAFTEPLYAPTKNSISNTEIKTIKIIQSQKTGVKVNKGIANNGSIIRIDIFQKDNKNYVVPIYIADKILANQTVDGKSIDNFKFLFSLFPRDLIKITKDNISELVYYVCYDRDSASRIEFIRHDGKNYNPWTQKNDCRISISSAEIDKYQVDVLGNYKKINKEKRLPINN